MAALGACGLSTGAARADAVADFYKGKTVTIIVSAGVGGSVDQTSRMIARHWPSHIPSKPNMIVTNMPGGGHLIATNYLYNVAPKDGTSIAGIIPSIVMHQLVDGKGVKFDSPKFQWIGSSITSNSIFYVWHTTGVKTLQDAMHKEVLMGATGAGSNAVRYPNIVNSVLGTKFKVVMGYKSAPEADLAVERGEIHGRAGITFNTLMAQNAEWVKQNKINILAQIGPEKEPGFENIPLITEFAKDQTSREILQLFADDIGLGRPYLAPPGVPATRVEMLRASFMTTMKDPGLLAESKKTGLDIAPTNGETLQKLVERMMNTSPKTIKLVKSALSAESEAEAKAKAKAKGGK
jgi:tripartite-type tricarboxylate transporter receptor subunit TctC